MCGIAGYVDFRRRTVVGSLVERMAASLRHRGPDAQGIYADGPCGLAHARLSIIDLAGSPQPMILPDSSAAIAYNGELYDYADQRRALIQTGDQLTTHGDTEVVLRLVSRSWIDALDQLDGMFAFGVWSRQRDELLLARDPLGEKPLFYANPQPGLLVFASEARAIFEHPEVQVEVDPAGLRQSLRFRAVYGEQSFYRGVKQLEPGAWLTFGQTGLKTGRYFDLANRVAACSQGRHRRTTRADIEQGDDLLVRAVRKRLVADVPVGVFLSGGLDSSLVAAVIRECRGPGSDLRTFSVGFENDTKSELPHARVVADHLHATHTEVRVGPADYVRHLHEMTAYRGAPLSEPADVAVGLLSRRAVQDVKVVLSGEGADEFFCGYPKYHFARVPSSVSSLLSRVGPERLGRLAVGLGLDRHRAGVVSRSLCVPSPLSRMLQWFSYISRPQLQELLPDLGWTDADWEATARPQAAAYESVHSQNVVTQMQLVDGLTWLPGNLLERGDRMTMQAGLEARMPFMDRQLAPWGISLPTRVKLALGRGKWIVRKWASARLPAQIMNRKKWGFRVPLAAWFRGELRGMLFDTLQSSSGLISQYGDSSVVRRLLQEHDRSETDHSMLLWTLLTLDLWFQQANRPRERTELAASTP